MLTCFSSTGAAVSSRGRGRRTHHGTNEPPASPRSPFLWLFLERSNKDNSEPSKRCMKTKRHAHVVSAGIVFVLFSFLPCLDLGSDGPCPRTVSRIFTQKLRISKHWNSAALFICCFASFSFSAVDVPGRKSLNVSSSSVLALGVTQREGERQIRPRWSSNRRPFPPPIAPRCPLPLHTRRDGGFLFSLNPF